MRVAGIAVMVLLGFGSLRDVRAQGAWVGYPGSLGVKAQYELVRSTGTVFPDGTVQTGPTRSHTLTAGAEYIPIEKLAVELYVPMTAVAYTGDPATYVHYPNRRAYWDDGNTHFTLTDLRLGARYQVLEEPYVALSPHLAVSIPMMDYETIGLATGGRHLKQLHVGASVARTFEPFLPSLYASVTYEFSLGERYDANAATEAIKQMRSTVAAEVGYGFLDGKLGLNVATNLHRQHGGRGFNELTTMPPFGPEDLVLFHDGILDEDFWFLGGGVSYSVTEAISVGLFARFFVKGQNTRDQQLFGLAASWTAL